MERTMEVQKEEKICEICGDKSFPNRILTCSQCGDQEHDYCSSVPHSMDTDGNNKKVWTCEKCQTKDRKGVTRDNTKEARRPRKFSLLNRDCMTRVTGSMRSRDYPSGDTNQRGKVKFLSFEEVIRLEKRRKLSPTSSLVKSNPCQINQPMSVKSPRKVSKKSEFFKLRSSKQVTGNCGYSTPGSTKISRHEYGSKLPEQANQVLEDRIDDAVMVQQENQATRHVGKELPKEAKPPSVDIGTFNSCEKEKSKDKVSAIPTQRGFLHKSKYSPSRYPNLSREPAPDDQDFESIRGYSHVPSSDAPWRGRFKLSIKDSVLEYYGPFLAYSPARAVPKAFEFSGLIPTDLHVELIPQSQLLIHTKFFGGGPNFDDIGLFFFADFESDSGCMNYDYLTKLMKTQDCAIRGTIIDDVDILIFTSNHLPLHTQWLNKDLFLWAVFYIAKKDPAPLNLHEEFEAKDSDPEHLIEGAEDTLGEPDENSATKRVRLAEWTPPSHGWVKLNSSAVLRGDRVGIGGSVYGPSGKWIFGYVQNLGQYNCTQLRADLWALLLGLKLVAARGYKKVYVETDSEQALKCLNTDPDDSDPNADFIISYRKLHRNEWLISPSVVSVEKNWPAVMIAKNFEDHPLLEETILHDPTPPLMNFIDSVDK